jgi:nucleotidyltransferase substrate binding protein (TIGR01987 family)
VERLRERRAEARAALATLRELVEKPRRSAVERDAAIMRFAYTFEAVWKAAQRYLVDREGLDVGSPKQCVRACRQVGLLDDDQAQSALQMADDRNLIVHLYRESIARDLDRRLRRHATILATWLAALDRTR